MREELLKIFSSPPFPLILRVNNMRGMRVKYFPPFPFPPLYLMFSNKKNE